MIHPSLPFKDVPDMLERLYAAGCELHIGGSYGHHMFTFILPQEERYKLEGQILAYLHGKFGTIFTKALCLGDSTNKISRFEFGEINAAIVLIDL